MSQMPPMPEQLLNVLRELIQQGPQRAFPNWNALRSELCWPHYRLLSTNDATRLIGQQPAAQLGAHGEPTHDR